MNRRCQWLSPLKHWRDVVEEMTLAATGIRHTATATLFLCSAAIVISTLIMEALVWCKPQGDKPLHKPHKNKKTQEVSTQPSSVAFSRPRVLTQSLWAPWCNAAQLKMFIRPESPISARSPHLQDSNDPFVPRFPLLLSFVQFDTELCTFQGMLTLAVAYFLETGVREAFCRPRKLEDKPQLVENEPRESEDFRRFQK